MRSSLLILSLFLIIGGTCDEIEGGCASGVDECGICGGDDFNNDNYCQTDLDILQYIKNVNNSLSSIELQNIGYQIWDEFSYEGYTGFNTTNYVDVPYRRLVLLDLSYSEITNVPFEISYFSIFGYIRVLNFNHNQIETLPASFCALSESTYIYLYANNICNETIYPCFDNHNRWHIDTQNQSNCCDGSNGEPNWTPCPED